MIDRKLYWEMPKGTVYSLERSDGDSRYVIKADYSKIASYYDRGRSLSEQNTRMWLDLIVRLSGASPSARILDLGCGTGRFSLPMAQWLEYEVTGADSSTEMLAVAKEKDADSEVSWVLAD